MTIEPKGVDPYQVDNMTNYMATTNNGYCVKVEVSDQRYCIGEISDKRAGDYHYWEYMYKNVFTREVGQHFFNYLCNIPDGDEELVPLLPPVKTAIKSKATDNSLSSIELFIKEVKSGDVFITYLDPFIYKGEKIATAINKATFYDLYRTWCKINDEKISSSRYFTEPSIGKIINHKQYGRLCIVDMDTL
jgi:hypothetical protein